MEWSLELTGTDATEDESLALLGWLKDERIPDLQVSQATGKPQPGQMGIELLSILSVVGEISQLGPLITAIGGFLSARSSKATIVLKNGDKELKIEAANLPELQATVDQAMKIFATAS